MSLGQSIEAANPPGSLDKELQVALEAYLDADCAVGPVKKADRVKTLGPLRRLLQFKDDPELQAKLIEILKGSARPNDLAQAQIEAKLSKQWQAIQTSSAKGFKRLESSIQPGRAENITKEFFIKRGLERFTGRNQRKAAVALVALSTPDAKSALAAAGQKDPALAKLIRIAYARFSREGEKVER